MFFLLTGCPKTFYKYSLTTNTYHCSSDLLEKARAEFGSTAVLAEWKDIKASYGNNIAVFCNNIGLEAGEINSAFVTRNGDYKYENQIASIIYRDLMVINPVVILLTTTLTTTIFVWVHGMTVHLKYWSNIEYFK